MSMVVRTNISSLNSHRNLKNISKKQTKASEKLASGSQLSNAANDAAGLAISEKMRAQIRGLGRAQQNVEDGINLIQTMDGSMNEISAMVIRQRELVIQALNDTYTDEDREKIQQEIDQLTTEIDDIANRTDFNNIPLLSGVEGDEKGPSSPLIERATVKPPISLSEYSISHIDYDSSLVPPGLFEAGTLTINGGETLVVNTPQNTNIEFTIIKPDGTSVLAPAENMKEAGVYKFIVNNTSNIDQSFNACLFLSEWTSPGEVWIQAGSGSNQGMNVDLYDCRAASLGIAPILVKPQEVAEASLGKLDNSLDTLNEYRARAGAQQNRLGYAKDFLGIAFENMASANSRIADTDMAKEMMELTKANIIQQAGVSMLTQANQQPQSVLQLLNP